MNHSEFESVDKFLRECGVGRRSLNDRFFEDTYEACKVFRRTGVTVEDNEEFCHRVMREFSCSVPGCNVTFRNLVDYEIHYNGTHRYACQECKTTRPNSRLLEIHIQETHDSFFQVLAEKKSMYQCYVSECEEKFASPNVRRAHCIEFHKFPKNFRYDGKGRRNEKIESKNFMEVEQPKEIQNRGKKNKVRLDKNQKSRTFVPIVKTISNVSRMECENSPSPVSTDNKMSELSIRHSESLVKICESTLQLLPPISKGTLSFVPRQVAQKSYTKALTKNKSMERNVLENNSMMDLAETLPD